jgi:hypothetical protein
LTFITASLVVLGEKLGGGPVDRSTGMLGIVSGALFLGSSRVRPTLLMASERLPHTWTASRKHTWTDVGTVCVMCIMFSPVWCTSIQIAATLGYE